MINVVQQSTDDRKKEIVELFNGIKPFLDEGYSLNNAIRMFNGRRVYNTKNGWYRDLVEYMDFLGYDYRDYLWKRPKKPIKK